MGLFFNEASSIGLNNHLKKSLNNDIENFEKELFKSENFEKEFDKLRKIANNVFSKAFNVKYKFTYEDLKFDIKEKNLAPGINNQIDYICDSLNEMEFDKQKITKERLYDISAKLSDLIEIISGEKTIDFENKVNNEKEIIEKEEDIDKEIEELYKKEQEIIQDTKKIEFQKEDKKKEGFFSRLFKKKEEQKQEPLPVVKEENEELKEETKIMLPASLPIKTEDLPEIKEELKEPGEEIVIKSPTIKKEKAIKKINQKKSKKIEDSLPAFKISAASKLKLKDDLQKKELIDIAKGLRENKKGVSQEIQIIEKEERVLKKEKKKLKEVQKNKDELPAFKILDHNIKDQIDSLEIKKKELEKQEKEIDERLKEISVMEQKLKELSKKLKEDDYTIKEKKEIIKKKEDIIQEIKKELTNKYDYAIKEIDSLKEELKEKEANFMKLQNFYQKREIKLSHEEGNLLKDKKEHSKIVSSLLQKHLILAKKDLEIIDSKLSELKEKNRKAENTINEYEKKFQKIVEEKDLIKKEIIDKKEYFENVEKEFKEKDPQYEELRDNLEERMSKVINKESELMNYKAQIEKSKEELKQKQQSLELKEIDLKGIEKDIEKLNFELKNKETRTLMMKKHIEKRIASFQRLRKDIMTDITEEKKQIRKVERKLTSKGVYIDTKLKKEEAREKGYNAYEKNLMDKADSLEEGDELRIDEVSISNMLPEDYMGNPSILDILRLLNIAKDFLQHNQNERARDAYLEIQRIFEDLNEEEREDVYPEIMNVFKTKKGFQNIFSNKSENMPYINETNEYEGIAKIRENDFDSLLNQFQVYAETGDLVQAEQIYSLLQQKYLRLPQEQKELYYPQIMSIYNRVLEQQVSFGNIS